MCAIAGVVGMRDRVSAAACAQAMINALARRGPDGEGLEQWNDAAFAHRRLAIFDLSTAGSQPMLTADRRVGVVFNGAIYNFQELREQLQLRGCSFVSQTDTEVLIHGYVEWGIDELVRKLRGMFAFALWDDRSQRLYLVRDRIGVKPLAYAVRGDVLVFASTPRALSAARFANDFDEDAVKAFLELGYLADDLSIYQGVYKVPAASIVEWSGRNLSVRKYWSPPSMADVSFDAAVEETRRLLLDAVRVRLHADVEVGSLLSGGIDSSLICWAVKELGGNIRGYTVGTPGDAWDETAAAIETAKRLGVDHCIVEMPDDVVPDIDELVCAYAEPFGSASALGMLRVAKAISNASNVKVLLTGDGGDDVFLGYPRHRNFLVASKLAQFLPREAAGLWRMSRPWLPRKGLLRRAAALMDYSTGGLAAAIRHARMVEEHEIDPLLGDRLRVLNGRRNARWQDDNGRRLLAAFLEYEFDNQFVGELMTKVDGATMHHGIEARSPFLDQYLWGFASSIPYGTRLHHGQLKAVLRAIVRKEVASNIASRRKRGFGIPVQRWIVRRWRKWTEELMSDSLLEQGGWIRRGAALRRFNRSVTEGVAPSQLWYVIVLESWMRYEQRIRADADDVRIAALRS
jgi:asparagine synthase (glutamine-hydrolysing)